MNWSLTWKSFWAKTPPVMKKIGDGLAGVSSVSAAGSVVTNTYPKLGIAVAIAGWVGKFLIECFREEPTQPPQP